MSIVLPFVVASNTTVLSAVPLWSIVTTLAAPVKSKSMKILQVLLFCCLLSNLKGQAPQENPMEIIEIGAIVGDTLFIKIPSNITTGYKWSMYGVVNARYLRFIKEDYITNANLENKVGVGGTEVFAFEVKKRGKTTIKMKYHLPWAPKEKPPYERIYKVKIKL